MRAFKEMSGAPTSRCTYDRDERGIAYGARALWRRRPRSSRGSHDRPRRTGKPSTGRRGQVIGHQRDREVCVMQNAETVLGVLRERGRRGLPCEELYRQLFNPQLYLLAYGRIYSNKGAMTPGVTQETVDGMSLGKIERIIDAMRHERYRFARSGGSTSRRRTGRRARWACRPGRTSWSARWCACCLRRTTSRRSPTAPTVSVPAGAATPRCGRWPTPGPGRPGSSRATSPTASAVLDHQVMLGDPGGEDPR